MIHSCQQAQIELAHEQAIHLDDAQAFLRDRAGQRAEHRKRREQHHIAGDLEHDVRDCIEHFDDALAALAEGRQGNPEEQREHHDLQDLVARHRFDDADRNEVREEALQRERTALHAARCGGGGLGEWTGASLCPARTPAPGSDPSVSEINGGADEPRQRFAADAPYRHDVAHLADAHHQGARTPAAR